MPLVVWKSRLDTCSRHVVHWQDCHNGFWKSLEKTQSETLGGDWPIMSGLVNAVACNKYWVDLAVSKTFTSFLPLCSVQNAIHVECRIVWRQWLVSGHCGLSWLGQRVTEEQFTHSSGSQVLLYLNISQHLGYSTSTFPTQHRNAQFEEPTLFTYFLVKSSISTINTFDVFTSKPKMVSAALHISYFLLIL